MPPDRMPWERLAIVEEQNRNLRDDVAELSRKVEQLSEFIQALKGARWATVTIAGALGFLAGISHKLVAYFLNPHP